MSGAAAGAGGARAPKPVASPLNSALTPDESLDWKNLKESNQALHQFFRSCYYYFDNFAVAEQVFQNPRLNHRSAMIP
jgi:hypothetical protein